MVRGIQTGNQPNKNVFKLDRKILVKFGYNSDNILT